MCLDFDVEGSKGVCGSPQDTLEVFKLTEQVRALVKFAHSHSHLYCHFKHLLASVYYVVENRDVSVVENRDVSVVENRDVSNQEISLESMQLPYWGYL